MDAFEHRSLLDMKFQVPKYVAAYSRLWNRRWIEPELTNHLSDGFAVFVAPLEQRGIEGAGQRPASKERDPEADALLIGERNDFDSKAKPAAGEGIDQGDCDDDPQHTVESARARDRVHV